MADMTDTTFRPAEAGNLYAGDEILLAGDIIATVAHATWVPSEHRADVCEITLGDGTTFVCLLGDTFDRVVPAWEGDVD
jgi:hypothetical protein